MGIPITTAIPMAIADNAGNHIKVIPVIHMGSDMRYHILAISRL